MSSRLAPLALRKAELIARCAQQRDQLTESCKKFQRPYLIAAAVGGLIRVARSGPGVLLALSSLLGARAGRLNRAVGIGLTLWQTLRPAASRWSRKPRP